MIKPKILVKGDFAPEDVIISFNQSSKRKINKQLELKLKVKWLEIYKDAKDTGKLVYNGESYRLDDYKIENDKLHLEVSLIKYEKRISLNSLTTELESLGEDFYCNGLSVGGLILTSDDKYLFGIKANKAITIEKGNMDVIGGIIENVELTSGEGIIKKNKEEILEETGIVEDYIDDIKIVGLVRTPSTNIIAVTSTRLNIHSESVKKIFKSGSDRDEEMKDIVFYNKYDATKVLREWDSWKSVLVDFI